MHPIGSLSATSDYAAEVTLCNVSKMACGVTGIRVHAKPTATAPLPLLQALFHPQHFHVSSLTKPKRSVFFKLLHFYIVSYTMLYSFLGHFNKFISDVR